LILLIDPHKESLVVVVEDTSSLRPVSLEESRLEILVITLEEEMISSELLLLVSGQVSKRVVLTLKFSCELREGSNNLALNFISLLSGDSWAEGVLSEVSANSDTSGVDHLVLIGRESRAVELGEVHVWDMLVLLGVAVILVDDLVEEGSEGIVRIVRSSINTNTWVGPFAARVDSLLESESKLVLLVLELLPNLRSEALGKERLCSSGEVGEVSDLIWAVKVRTNKSSSGSGFSNLQGFS
jgi:hypothetical protein